MGLSFCSITTVEVLNCIIFYLKNLLVAINELELLL